jgi:hypothetical protein
LIDFYDHREGCYFERQRHFFSILMKIAMADGSAPPWPSRAAFLMGDRVAIFLAVLTKKVIYEIVRRVEALALAG